MEDKVKSIIGIICLIASIAIATIALFMPVVGIIDSSVLWFTAQLLCLCASVIGIKFSIKDVFNKSSRKD